MPVDCGSITPNSAHAATAASTAVPPARITSIAVSAARGCEVAAIAFWAWTVDRPARWKFLMKKATLCCFCFPADIRRAGLHGTFGPRWAMLGGGWERYIPRNTVSRTRCGVLHDAPQ